MHTKKGYNTGFRDTFGREIHVGDKVVEGCNLFVSIVCWDYEQATYKMKGLGNYYITDANTDWIVIETFDEIKEDAESFPYECTLAEFKQFQKSNRRGF